MLLYNNRTNAELDVSDDVAHIFLAQGDWEEIFESTATEVVDSLVSNVIETVVEEVVEDVVEDVVEFTDEPLTIPTKSEIQKMTVGEARELASRFGVGVDGMNGTQVKKSLFKHFGL